MGGGGGGGQQNNTQARDGGNGGGIVLIKALTIETTGPCAGLSISANGVGPANNGSNDGGGGGGAGGSIVFWVDNWNISASCPLTISGNGGNGSTSNTGAPHGGGGAGAQGVVIFNGATPTTNVSTTTNNGTPGCDISNCSVVAGSASGVNGSGVLSGANINNPLPVELLTFSARALNHHTAKIEWSTASEQNASHFTIRRSSNGLDWVDICTRNATGNSNSIRHYNCVDPGLSAGVFYFQLVQHDLNGQTRTYGPVSAEIAPQKAEIKLYPNPAELDLFVETDFDIHSISIYSIDGKLVRTLSGNQSPNQRISLEHLGSGMYLIGISDAFGNTSFERLIRE